MLTRFFHPRALAALVATLAIATAVTACTATDTPTGPQVSSITDFVSSMTSGDGTITAALRTGSVPAGGSGAAVAVTVPFALIQGGSAQIPVTSTVPISRIVVAMQGTSDYYELLLSEPTTATSIIINIEPEARAGRRTLRIAGGAASTMTPFASSDVLLLDVGTGELQISASWDSPADVDLSVETPSGERIFYGNESAQGGTLDLDSNAACRNDRKNNENIVWTETPPTGTYVVRLSYFSSCTAAATNWLVAVRTADGAVQTFSGRFTGTGGSSTPGSGAIITTFTR